MTLGSETSRLTRLKSHQSLQKLLQQKSSAENTW
jgi:hypothetical protein